MARDKERQITKKGFSRLKKELKDRLVKLRKQIADKIDEARKQGDLSENSAYHSAIEQQQLNEQKIKDLQGKIADSKVVEERSGDAIVHIGDEVELEDEDGKVMKVRIVGPEEADSARKQISSESPLGKKALEKKSGDEFEIVTPGGKRKYRIRKVF